MVLRSVEAADIKPEFQEFDLPHIVSEGTQSQQLDPKEAVASKMVLK
jgi:hypothetical protein